MDKNIESYQHRCTQCYKVFDCQPCLDPKRNGLCSRVPYEYKVSTTSTDVSVTKTLELFFCKPDCFIECMALMEAVRISIERLLNIYSRLEKIILTAATADDADRMVDELFEEIENERKKMMEDLGSDWDATTSEESSSEKEIIDDDKKSDSSESDPEPWLHGKRWDPDEDEWV